MAVLHKYWKTAAMAMASYVGDSPLFLLDYLLRFVRVAVLISIWRTILDERAVVSGLTLATVLTYTLIAEVFAEQLTPRTDLESSLWEGSIATRFLQPMSIVGQFASEMVGRWAFGFGLCSAPLLLLAPLFGVNPWPASLSGGLLFVPSLVLAMSIGLAFDFIFGALIVALQVGIWAIQQLRAAATALLSGALLPLALLPWGLGDVFGWLPFASMASAPLRIYTGTGDPLTLMLIQAGWSIILWPVAWWMWNAHRERLAFYGG